MVSPPLLPSLSPHPFPSPSWRGRTRWGHAIISDETSTGLRHSELAITPVTPPTQNTSKTIPFSLEGEGRGEGARRIAFIIAVFLVFFSNLPAQDAPKPAPIAQAYLYLEPFHARVEVLFDVATVRGWLKQPNAPTSPMPLATRQQLSDSAAKAGADWCRLKANDVPAQGALSGVAIVKGKPGATLPYDEAESPNEQELMVGFMYEFSIPGAPEKIELSWSQFAAPVERLPLTIFHGVTSSSKEISTSNPSTTWTNDGKLPMPKPLAALPAVAQPAIYALPVITLIWVLFGIGFYIWMDVRNKKFPGGFLPFLAAWLFGVAITWGTTVQVRDPFAAPSVAISTPAAAEAVLQPLLRNVYRAFDYRNEEDIYDLLARSVDGELLRTLYLQIIQALTLDNAEGARVRVTDLSVTIEQVTPKDKGFIAHGQWTALGTVGHWGHQHQRLNRYKAKLTVNPVQSEWKITGLEVLEERRL